MDKGMLGCLELASDGASTAGVVSSSVSRVVEEHLPRSLDAVKACRFAIDVLYDIIRHYYSAA